MKEIIAFLSSLTAEQLDGFRKALALDRAQYAVHTLDSVRSSIDALIAIGPLRASEIFDAVDDVADHAIEQKELECPCGVSLYEHAQGTTIEDFLEAIRTREIVILNADEEKTVSEPTIH